MKIGSMNNPKLVITDEIKRIARQGFDFIDLTYEPPSNEAANAVEIKELLNQLELDVIGHSNPTLPAIYPDKKIRILCIEELSRTADFFISIGCNIMTVHPFLYGSLNFEEKIKANIEVMGILNEYCKKIGVALLVENFIEPFNNASVFTKMFNEIPGLMFHLDIGHCNIRHAAHEKMHEYYSNFPDKILHIHLHDNKGRDDEHLPVGAGNIIWPEVIKILKKNKYNSTITLEVFSTDPDYLLISKEKLEKLWAE